MKQRPAQTHLRRQHERSNPSPIYGQSGEDAAGGVKQGRDAAQDAQKAIRVGELFLGDALVVACPRPETRRAMGRSGVKLVKDGWTSRTEMRQDHGCVREGKVSSAEDLFTRGQKICSLAHDEKQPLQHRKELDNRGK